MVATAKPAPPKRPTGNGRGAGGGSNGREAPPADGQLAGGGDSYLRVQTSYPDSVDRHDISDEELTMLVDPRRDSLSNMKYACFGVAGGAALPAAASIYNLFKAGTATALDVAQIAGFVAFVVVTFAINKIDGKLAKGPTDLAAEIRARTKKRVVNHGR